MGSRKLFTLAVGIALLGAAGSSGAGPFQFPTGDPIFNTYPGDATNLPVGPRVTVGQAVSAARALEVTRVAFEEFQRRGYERHAESDTAVFVAEPGATIVVLAWRKPGFAPGPHSTGAPLVLVTTMVEPASGLASTSCTAGLVVLDSLNRAAFAADSLPGYGGTDGSFDVAHEAAGGYEEPGEAGGPILKRPLPGGTNAFTNPNSKFRRWLTCASWSALGCFAHALRFSLSPLAIVWIAAPEVAVSAVLTCQVGVAIGCIGAALAGHQ